MIWYKYAYPALACLGVEADCTRATRCSTNFFVCDHCCQRQWFESKIITFKSDAVTRLEAQRRMQAKEPIKRHREIIKQQKEFCKRGGQIQPIMLEMEQPTIYWDATGKTITAIKCNHN